ncbi:hypothetical protein HPP92_015467 [Vanilla planifolia]|uniref:Agenet domain-containing protein n=1 Tax=Vanilla planifolia TaxID=51239 RepID=A0A835UXV2_VANPL|nr:hypothetical protein HPP92_015467 [Vanilla planifolia]
MGETLSKPPCVVEGLELHKKMELMVRPRYPLFYRESDLPVPLPECDVIVISNDAWKVGDLVDWWCDGCFWSGKVTQILENEKVQIKLPDPPADPKGVLNQAAAWKVVYRVCPSSMWVRFTNKKVGKVELFSKDVNDRLVEVDGELMKNNIDGT